MNRFALISLAGLLFFTAVLGLWRMGNQSLLLVFMSFAIIAPLTYLALDRLQQQNALGRMKEEALRAELASLQSQIDPHFFFNTLNNLYGLTVAGSPRAPEMILKLSDLMRFTIYEGRKALVPVRAEVAYLERYLDLMSLRAKEGKLTVDFQTSIADDAVAVPPLMSVILIENAFKHGAATLTRDAVIDIRLAVDRTRLEVTVRNNYDPANRKEGKGIGLTNLKRRLALRYPGTRHALDSVDAGGQFTATMRIDLCAT